MSILTISKWIKIDPQYTDSRLNTHIRTELDKQMKNECNEDMGHVLNVVDVIELVDNEIQNSSSELVVLVKFTVEIFKPTPDMIIESIICAIYPDGILVEAHDIQKILIPTSTYTNKYTLVNNMLVYEDTPLGSGDKIQVRITAVRYDDHKFSCLGVIV